MLQTYFNDFDRAATFGDLCRGAKCRGWLLSDVDTWHHCGGYECGGKGAPHPDEETVEETLATRPWETEPPVGCPSFPVDTTDDIPF